MIYLDHAAATPLHPAVLKKMLPFLKNEYGNPSSIHSLGRSSRAAIDDARSKVAEILNCKPKEIIFTSSGTEANNMALFGAARGNKNKGNHIITTAIEHHSVLEPLQQLEAEGFKITYLKVDHSGPVSLQDLQKALTPETILVSIIYANNEIGTIQNIAEIGKLLKNAYTGQKGAAGGEHRASKSASSSHSAPAHKVVFHTDACQAAGALEIRPEKLGVDLMTINGSKIYGPKGAGALYIKEGTPVSPLIFGGGQEHRLRAGTENTAAIVGLAEALRRATANRPKDNIRLLKLQKRLVKELLKIPDTKLNGVQIPGARLPNNINIAFTGINAETLLLRLDMAGICVATSSACTSGAVEPSHVLTALGLPENQVKSSIRLSLGRQNTLVQINQAAKIITKIVEELRGK